MTRVLLAILVLLSNSLAYAASSDAVTTDSELRTETSGVKNAEPAEEYATLDSLFTLYQPYIVNISAYEPIYFLVGTDPAKSKFQFSFKYCFFNVDGPLVKNHPWVEGFHFGYIQTSFWDLDSDSFPFEDTSYKPEIFHLSSNIKSRPSWIQGFFVQTGLQHESNGRSEESSRSSNFLYVKPIFISYNKESKIGLRISPKVWVYYDKDKHNSNLEDYRGYFELDTTIGKADSFVFGSSLRWAKGGASVQLDLTCPVSSYMSGNVDIYLHVQYASALAESLLDYEDRTEALRIGFSFVR